MQITTQTIIKILPFTEEFKLDLLNRIETMEETQKYEVTQFLWDTYYAIYELRLEKNLQLAYIQAEEGKEVMDKQFYKRVQDKTEQEMQQEKVTVAEQVDLSAARSKLEELLKSQQPS